MADENVTLPGADGAPQTTGAFYENSGLTAEDIGYLQSSKYDSWAGVIKALKDTKAYVGVDKNELIRVPRPDKDGNVDYTEVFKTLGRPDDASGYGLPDTEFAKAIAPELHKLGITKKQAEALNSFLNTYNESAGRAAQEAFAAKQEAELEALKKEWGADFSVREQSVGEFVRKLATAGFTADDFNNLQSAMGYEKAMKMFFAMAGSSDGIKNLSGYNAGVETPEIAAHKLKELQSDKEFVAQLAKQDPKAVKEMNRLVELARKAK